MCAHPPVPLRRPALWRSSADAASAQLGHEPLEDTLAKVLPAFGMVLLVIFGPVLVFMLCASVGSKVVDKKKAGRPRPARPSRTRSPRHPKMWSKSSPN